jgi:hypothetical protein
MADPNGVGDGTPSDDQRDAARSILESVIDNAAPGGSVPYRSTAFGPGGGALGFGYRSGSLMVEYQDDVNAADDSPATTAATAELVELDDHTPLSNAGTDYVTLQRSILELIAETVTGTPDPQALEPVTVWPVANEPGLYRVGYEVPSREFLYAIAFKIPASALG